MSTNKSIRLAAKCQAILELIQRVNNRQEAKVKMLKEYNQSPLFHVFGRQIIEGYIENNTEIIERLERYFVNTAAQLADEASKQFFPVAA